MIPEPLKWAGALAALVILVVVVTPMAVEAMFETVSLSDEGGLFGGGDDEADDLEPAEDEDGDAEDVEEDTEGEAGEEPEDDAEPEDVPDSYVVESGDTLYDIAQQVYGDGERWPEIAEANELEDDTLRVGEELDIP